MSEKIKILYLSSSPDNQSQLGVDKEFREIYERFVQEPAILKDHLREDGEFRAIYENSRNKYFSVVSVSNLQACDIQAVILKNVPEIIHFAGHASANEIFFEDAGKKSIGVSKNALVNFLEILRKKPIIIFFNACRTMNILKRLNRIIDFVVVTEQEVDDAVAITFAAEFYKFLSLGQTVKTAFECAKNQFEIEGRKKEAETYKLFMRGKDRSLVFPENDDEEKKVDPLERAIPAIHTVNIADKISGQIISGNIKNVQQHFGQAAEKK